MHLIQLFLALKSIALPANTRVRLQRQEKRTIPSAAIVVVVSGGGCRDAC